MNLSSNDAIFAGTEQIIFYCKLAEREEEWRERERMVPRTLGANATIFDASPSPMFVLAVTQKSYLRVLSNSDASWVS